MSKSERMELPKFSKYVHFDREVWVRTELQGKHRSHCLCWSCKNFNEDDLEAKCPIADKVYKMCLLHDLVLPVWECPIFEEDNDTSND